MRTMNWLLKSEMKFKGVKLSLLFFFVLLSYSSNASFGDQTYYRKSFKLDLKKGGEFQNTDTLLTPQNKGNWSIKNNRLILSSGSDSSEIIEKYRIVYSSQNKITVSNNGMRYSYHDKDSFNGTGISFTTITKGILGMAFLFFIAFITFSISNKWWINTSLCEHLNKAPLKPKYFF